MQHFARLSFKARQYVKPLSSVCTNKKLEVGDLKNFGIDSLGKILLIN